MRMIRPLSLSSPPNITNVMKYFWLTMSVMEFYSCVFLSPIVSIQICTLYTKIATTCSNDSTLHAMSSRRQCRVRAPIQQQKKSEIRFTIYYFRTATPTHHQMQKRNAHSMPRLRVPPQKLAQVYPLHGRRASIETRNKNSNSISNLFQIIQT